MCLGISFVCGVIAAGAASVRSRTTASFLTALILLPMIVCTVIMMVNGNVGTGVAVMGAFSLVRFRSVAGRAREIAVLFLAMTAGLSCAAGQLGLALIFTGAVSAVLIAVAFLPVQRQGEMDLRITVPETLCIADAFSDVFTEYTSACTLVHTKTTNMGSLYRLHYRIRMKDKAAMQAFIDKLRTRNGNLEIAIGVATEGCEEM